MEKRGKDQRGHENVKLLCRRKCSMLTRHLDLSVVTLLGIEKMREQHLEALHQFLAHPFPKVRLAPI